MTMLAKFHGKWHVGLLLSGLLAVLLVAGVMVFHLGITPKASASAALWPATASPGGTIFATGSGFPGQEQVKVYFQTPDRGIVTAVTNASGTFSVPLTLPSVYIPGTQYYVYVNSDVYSTQIPFHFAKPNLSLADPKTQPTFGSPTSFTGIGFKPNENVNLVWNYPTGSTLNAGTVVTGSDGSFNTILTPPSIPYLSQAKLVATGSSSDFSASTAMSEAANMLYDPSSGPAGTIVHVKGGAFGSNELVDVSFKGTPVATAQANAYGAFTASFTVGASQLGFNNDLAGFGHKSKQRVQHGFKVTPKVKVSRQKSSKNTVVVSGNSFTQSSPINITLNITATNSSQVVTVNFGNVTTSNTGSFSVPVTLPGSLGNSETFTVTDLKTGVPGSVSCSATSPGNIIC
jgi:hypothetical protein